MKTKLFTLFSTFLLIISCQNHQPELVNECQECKTIDYTTRTFKIGNDNFNIKDYNVGNSNDPDFLTINTSDTKIHEIIKFISSKNFEKKTRAVILFSNKAGQTNNLKSVDVDAFAIYEEYKDNVYNVRLFKKENKIFIENKISNLKSNIISSNDFKNMSLLFNNGMYKKTFVVINFKDLNNNNPQKLGLQNTLLKNSSVMAKSGSYCYSPCYPGSDAWCTATESQSGGERWFCLADPKPCLNDATESIAEQDESLTQYRISNTREFLHIFRDNYLSNENNGNRYVEIYYDFSKKIDYSKINTTFIKETFTLINNMKPRLELLLNNKNSNSIIVIDDNTAYLLVTYLTKYSNMFSDQDSLDNIDFLINKINQFKNKSNDYITNNL